MATAGETTVGPHYSAIGAIATDPRAPITAGSARCFAMNRRRPMVPHDRLTRGVRDLSVSIVGSAA